MIVLPKYLTRVLCVVLVLFFYHRSIGYAASGTISIEPALIDVTLPQASKEAEIKFYITNNSGKQISLELFPLDFKQKDEFGRIAFLQENPGSYSYSLSSFLQFDTNNVELAPGEKKEIRAIATNRQDLSPGGHYAAIIARLLQSGKETAVSPAVSALVLLRKTGGERFNLSLKSVDWPTSALTFQYKRYIELLFQNEGNIHLVPYGRAEVKDMFGRLLYKGIINSPSDKVFPESRRYISVELKKIASSFPLSFNTVSIQGTDSLEETSFQYNSSFIYINPIFIFLVIVLIGSVWLIRRRKK